MCITACFALSYNLERRADDATVRVQSRPTIKRTEGILVLRSLSPQPDLGSSLKALAAGGPAVSVAMCCSSNIFKVIDLQYFCSDVAQGHSRDAELPMQKKTRDLRRLKKTCQTNIYLHGAARVTDRAARGSASNGWIELHELQTARFGEGYMYTYIS